MRPFITIGLTAWREGDLLQDAIQSLFAQSETNWRCNLVLDGNADEKTRAIATSVSDLRISVSSLAENAGPYAARAEAIRTTATDWFHLLDGDDTLPPDAVANFVKACKEREFDYYCGSVKIVWPDGRVEFTGPVEPSAKEILYHFRYPGMVAFRKDVWRQLGGYPQALIRGKADADMMLGLIEHRYRAHVTSKVVYEYRKRLNSVSASYAHDLALKDEFIISRHPDIFRDEALRRFVLQRAYLTSAWGCYEKRKYGDAAKWARKLATIGSLRAVWPLTLADRLPPPMLRGLVSLRFWGGHLQRGLAHKVAAASAGK